MKALILAGGHATRLWPVTKDKPKPLLPLAGKPILDYILNQLDKIEDIDQTYVTANEKFEDSFKNYLSRRKGNYELIIEKQSSEDEKLGALGGIVNAINNKGKDDYVIIGGDNYYSLDIKSFIDFGLRKRNIVNPCFKIESLEQAKQFGIMQLDEDKKVMDFEEKPENPKSKLASTALYFIPKDKLHIFDKYTEYWEGRLPKEKFMDEPGRFIRWTANNYGCYGYPFEGQWMDIGTREGYLKAEKILRDGKIIKGKITDSEIGENVTVLENTEVSNSKLENCIIFQNCSIENSIIENSIVGENSQIKDKYLRNSLVKEIG